MPAGHAYTATPHGMPGDTVLVELRLQGDRLTALVRWRRGHRSPGLAHHRPRAVGHPRGRRLVRVRGGAAGRRCGRAPPPTAGKTSSPRSRPKLVAQTGHGWRLARRRALQPGRAKFATLPLPGNFAGTSYQVRVKLRQLAGTDGFDLVLPVADRMVGLAVMAVGRLLHRPEPVNGQFGQGLPGSRQGQQVKDSEPHELEVTVRLDGANADDHATLDARPLYEWTGPIAALSQRESWKNDPARHPRLRHHDRLGRLRGEGEAARSRRCDERRAVREHPRHEVRPRADHRRADGGQARALQRVGDAGAGLRGLRHGDEARVAEAGLRARPHASGGEW